MNVRAVSGWSSRPPRCASVTDGASVPRCSFVISDSGHLNSRHSFGLYCLFVCFLFFFVLFLFFFNAVLIVCVFPRLVSGAGRGIQFYRSPIIASSSTLSITTVALNCLLQSSEGRRCTGSVFAFFDLSLSIMYFFASYLYRSALSDWAGSFPVWNQDFVDMLKYWRVAGY